MAILLFQCGCYYPYKALNPIHVNFVNSPISANLPFPVFVQDDRFVRKVLYRCEGQGALTPCHRGSLEAEKATSFIGKVAFLYDSDYLRIGRS
jgi:hypothetical protein